MPSALHLHILASGSKGNSALVEGPEGTVLIDCGLSRRELLNRMSSLHLDLNNLKAAFSYPRTLRSRLRYSGIYETYQRPSLCHRRHYGGKEIAYKHCV